MTLARPTLLALALACAFPCSAHAASDAEIKELREQLKELKDTYEQRIRALESRLERAESAVRAAPPATPAQPAVAEAQRAPAPAAPKVSTESAFNPGISLILSGTYTNLERDPASYQITGFVPSLGEVGPPPRSFSLGESELVLSANIDPHFHGHFTAALTPENQVEVEEAYIQTLALGQGFTFKGGRFFSGIGYMNEQHAHVWDFTDAPLPYKAFFANQIGSDGVQLKWVAPTELFLELGAEAARGGSFPSTDRNKNGSTLGSVFAHLGGDIGASTNWRAGVSYVDTSPRDRAYEDADSLGGVTSNSFSGTSNTTIADFVLKWSPDGNPKYTNFKLQGEYFWRREDGTLSFDDSTGSALFGTLSDSYRSRQTGWYLQGVYQFMPYWRVGYRYDRLNYGTVDIGLVTNGPLTAGDFPLLTPHDPTRNTVMLDWNPSEFSRVRLQYAQDKSAVGVTDNQLWLQYIMSLGAHGSHKF